MSIVICEGVDWTKPDNPDRRCTVFVEREPDCDPRCRENREPTGYVEKAEWAEHMSRTHEQRQCPGCGLWTIWEQR